MLRRRIGAHCWSLGLGVAHLAPWSPPRGQYGVPLANSFAYIVQTLLSAETSTYKLKLNFIIAIKLSDCHMLQECACINQRRARKRSVELVNVWLIQFPASVFVLSDLFSAICLVFKNQTERQDGYINKWPLYSGPCPPLPAAPSRQQGNGSTCPLGSPLRTWLLSIQAVR